MNKVQEILRDYMDKKNKIGLGYANEVFCTQEELEVLLQEPLQVLIDCIKALDDNNCGSMCPHCRVYRYIDEYNDNICGSCPIANRTEWCTKHPVAFADDWDEILEVLLTKGISEIIDNAQSQLNEYLKENNENQ